MRPDDEDLLGVAAADAIEELQMRVRSLEQKYGRILLVRGVSGAQAARIILLRGEIPQVDVDESAVSVTDFYSAFEPAIKLSPANHTPCRPLRDPHCSMVDGGLR